LQKQALHFLKIEDEGRLYRKKHVSNPCRDSAMHMVTARCNRDQSMRSSKHLSQLNSLNQQPFKNEESSFDLASTELHGPNLHLENLEDDRDLRNSVHQRVRRSNLDPTNLALPMHRPQKNVQRTRTAMVVGDEHTDNLGDELNGDGRSADPADRARGRRKPPRSELGGRPNNQKAARSSSRRNMNLNLNCLNRTTIRDYDI